MFSRKFGVDMAFELRFHFFKYIIDGKKVEDKNHAQAMPNPIVKPYPINAESGARTKERNATIVVTLVRKIGNINEFIVPRTEFSTFPVCLIFLKNLVIICTLSEFAIVNRIIGMEVFSKEK